MKIGEKPNEKHEQRPCTRLLEKYGGIYLYDIDIEKRYEIDDEEIHFVNKYGYDLIGNPDNPNGTSTDNEYFIIHNELFDRAVMNQINIVLFIHLPVLNQL